MEPWNALTALIACYCIINGKVNAASYSDTLLGLGTLPSTVQTVQENKETLRILAEEFMPTFKSVIGDKTLVWGHKDGVGSIAACVGDLNATLVEATRYRQDWAMRSMNTK